jgi:hypothetical protein
MCSSQVSGSIFDTEPNGIHPFPYREEYESRAVPCMPNSPGALGRNELHERLNGLPEAGGVDRWPGTRTAAGAQFPVVHLVYVGVPFV